MATDVKPLIPYALIAKYAEYLTITSKRIGCTNKFYRFIETCTNCPFYQKNCTLLQVNNPSIFITFQQLQAHHPELFV